VICGFQADLFAKSLPVAEQYGQLYTAWFGVTELETVHKIMDNSNYCLSPKRDSSIKAV